ncbi:insulin-like growth factor-binding protein 3 receptor [Hyperolius riggenbachi]|uniref:insulin-like growth factor-binding protein 3 receptor n=1 Tax=Hyperolius riggenbachi TaxID=752182 RepID=UPI0035A3CEAA
MFLRLRSCIVHLPATVTFLACLLVLGFTFLGLGEFLKRVPVRDADSAQDWDSVLQVLSAYKICTLTRIVQPPTTTRTASPEDIANVSVLAMVTISPWQPAFNHSTVEITATGSQLGMRGPSADAPLNVTLSFDWWSILCNGSDAPCSMKSCITITGPQDLLPHTKSSSQCAGAAARSPGPPEPYVLEEEPALSSTCHTLIYAGDPGLRNMVSKEDAAVCIRRLQYTGLAILSLGICLSVIHVFIPTPSKEKWTAVPL